MKRIRLLLTCCIGISGLANASVPDRFGTIATRNVFRLNPPTPQNIEVPPVLNRPQITLEGVTTILGRTQALLTFQHGSNPANARHMSYVLSRGDSRLDVVVLEINAELGTVRLNNVGLEECLALK